MPGLAAGITDVREPALLEEAVSVSQCAVETLNWIGTLMARESNALSATMELKAPAGSESGQSRMPVILLALWIANVSFFFVYFVKLCCR